jgi:hypothetical protein
MSEAFGRMLQKARRNCHDPERGGLVTQEQFAEFLSQHLGNERAPTAATVSNWERGRTRPRNYSRETLRTIVAVLLRCGGLTNLTDAGELLLCGGYAPLTQEEAQYFREVTPKATAATEGHREQARPTTAQEMARVIAGEYASNQTQPQAGENALPSPSTRTRSEAQPVQAAMLIAIRHQSMEQIPTKAILSALPAYLQGCDYTEIVIDQCDLFQNGRLSDPHQAARRQHDVEKQVAALLARHPEAHLAYYAIAHIPLLFLAGYTLSHRWALLHFAEDRYTRSWDLLQRGGAAPTLTLSGLPSAVVWEQGDVVIRINVSYRVLEQAVAEIVAAPLASLELSLAQPQLDIVTSEQQLRDYTQPFRQMMDQVHALLPRATCIHVFYAGPPALAFCCGQQISKTIHPRIVVYNYFGKDVPRYSWGLDITQASDTEGFVVRPVVC